MDLDMRCQLEAPNLRLDCDDGCELTDVDEALQMRMESVLDGVLGQGKEE